MRPSSCSQWKPSLPDRRRKRFAFIRSTTFTRTKTMSIHNTNRRGFLKKASTLALAPALPMIPGFAHAANSDLVVGTWGGDYQNLLQKFIQPIVAQDGVNVIYDTGN